MSTPSKRKGSAFEREIVEYLRGFRWIHAERRLAGDTYDKGDITGIPGVVIECKNQARMQLAEWVDELVVEMHNARAMTGAVVHKRKGTMNTDDYYATMPLYVWVWLLREAGF